VISKCPLHQYSTNDYFLASLFGLQGEGPYLMQALDQFASALAPEGSKLPPRIAQLPPPLCAVPCRPIVLDTALNAITFPSLRGAYQGQEGGWGALQLLLRAIEQY